MQIHFWGTRGSLPASITAEVIEKKIFAAVKMSRSLSLNTDEAIMAFVKKELPFDIRASFGGNTSCVEIRGQEEYVLCDAGTGLRDFGNAFLKMNSHRQDNVPPVFHIFISHLHWDHIQGFPFFTPAYIPGNQIHIYGGHENLEAAFVNQQSAPSFPVPLKAMKADIVFHMLGTGKIYNIAGLHVQAIRQNHPGDSFGFRFEREGKIMVYSTDAEHKDEAGDEAYEFISFFNKADLLIFDAQYRFLEAIGMKENWGHSSNLLAVELAVKAGVKHLCMFHSEHTYDDEMLASFLQETREYLKIHTASSPLKIYLAYDGMDLEI